VTPAALASPAWLIGGVAVVAVAELLRRRRPRPAALPLAFTRWLEGLPRGWRVRARAAFPALRVALLLLFAAAVAGPSLSWRAQQETRRGVDVLVALDASSSMTVVLPGSFASTRFNAARAAAQEFAARRPEDRIGLTTFARYPRAIVPLTWDHALFDALVQDVGPVDAGSEEDLTAIGVALADGAERLRRGTEGGRALVLVTDGANNVGPISPDEGVRLCKEARVRVYTIAFTGEARFGGGAAPPDTRLLAEIAAATGGRAFEAQDRAALDDACRSIDELESSSIELTSGLRAWPLASPLLAVALLGWLALSAADRLLLRSLP
jgi:Ca-activated chloride channel family protein